MKQQNLLIQIKNRFTLLYLAIILLSIATNSFAQTPNVNRFFVNKGATGNNNGDSWENAWTSFANINWASFSSGDTLFISGGTVSTIYNESMTIGRSDITITKGLSSGHNGRVILRSPTTQSGTGISITNRQNIKIMNLEFDGWDFGIDARGTVTNGIDSILVQNNRFSCYSYAFYTQGGSTASDSAGNNCHDIYILDNYIEQAAAGSDADIQIDGISYKCARNIFVIGNTFINRDTQVDDSHSDFVEGQWNTNQYYFNNLFYIENNTTVGQNGVQHGGNSAGDFYFANNIFMMGQYTTQSAIWSELFGRHWGNMRVVNNTFIGANPRFLYLGGYPKAVIKNNLFWNTRTMGSRPSFIYVEAEDGETDELVVENNNFYYNGTQEYMTGTNTPPRPVSNGWFLESSYQPTLSNFTVSPETYSNCPYSENLSDYYITSGSTREWGAGGALLESDFPTSLTAPGWFKVWDYIGKDGNGNTKSQWDIGAVEPYSNVGGDLTAPQLVSASLINSTTLVLNFSEALNSSTAQNKNNYSISNGITVSSAVLSGTQVTLTTSAHISGAYIVTVNNVTDLAGNVVDPQHNLVSYEYISTDIIPPQVISASIVDSITVKVYFSENLETSTSQNINNYDINGINITSASLNANVVTLATTIHSAGVYSVGVSNVTDLAGNLIDPQNNSAIYEYQQQDPGLLMLPVSTVLASIVTNPDYNGQKTIDGKGYYEGDPTSKWVGETMPEWLVYDLGDVQIINTTKLSFNNWNGGRIYNYSIQLSTDSLSWNNIRTNVASSIEEWSVEDIGPIEARYIKIVFISSNQNDWAGLWEAQFWGYLKMPTNLEDDEVTPVSYILEQNYPNPFNPTTKIRVQLPQNTQMRLAVYNMLGELIIEIANGEFASGSHEFSFDASGLASGMYLYRVESPSFTETKKMVLLR